MLLHVPALTPFVERRTRTRNPDCPIGQSDPGLQPLKAPSLLQEPADTASLHALADEADAAELRLAIEGDAEATRRLIKTLLPAVRGCVRARLQSVQRGDDIGRAVEDLCQEVFLQIFAQDAAVLRRWMPDKGLSLSGFVALVADRLTISELRRRRPTDGARAWEDELGACADPCRSPEDWLHSQQCLSLLRAALLERLSPLGQRMFELLFVQELAVDEIAQRLDMGADAVYAWRSRLRKRATEILTLAKAYPFEESHR